MRLKTYYLWSLLLPIIVPVLMIGVHYLVKEITGEGAFKWLPSSLWFASIVVAASIIAVIPYTLTAGCIAWWLRHKNTRVIRNTALVLPVLFGVVVIPFSLMIENNIRDAMAGALISAGVGYIYVAFVLGSAWLLTKCGRLKAETNQPVTLPTGPKL